MDANGCLQRVQSSPESAYSHDLQLELSASPSAIDSAMKAESDEGVLIAPPHFKGFHPAKRGNRDECPASPCYAHRYYMVRKPVDLRSVLLWLARDVRGRPHFRRCGY